MLTRVLTIPFKVGKKIIYVDDGLVCIIRGSNIVHILDSMDKAFSNTQGPTSCYIGLNITRHHDTRELFLDKTHYLTRLVQNFDFQDSVPLSVHVDPYTHLSFLYSDDRIPNPSFPYQTIVGSFQFACIRTCLGLSYAISVAAKFCANPSPTHYNTLLGLFPLASLSLEMTIIFLLPPTTMQILQWTWITAAVAPDLFYLLIAVLFFGLLTNKLVLVSTPLRLSILFLSLPSRRLFDIDGFSLALVNPSPLLPICSPTTKVLCVLSKTLNFIAKLNIVMSNTTSFAKHFQPISCSLSLSSLMINWLISLLRHFPRKLSNACAINLACVHFNIEWKSGYIIQCSTSGSIGVNAFHIGYLVQD